MEHLAEDGHSQAMYRLAKAAVGGTGDPTRAFRLAHRAAVQGHRPAMRLLAELYSRGHGVDADEGQAGFWAAEGAGEQRQRGGLRRLLGRR
jgi:TPR repeat protein